MESIALLFSVLILGSGPERDEPTQIEKPATYQGKTATEWRDSLQDRDSVQRMKAANALGNLGPEARSATNQILAALRDEKLPDVRAELTWAICEMGPPAESTIPHLAVALKDVDSRVRRWAVRCLGKTNRPGMFQTVLAAVFFSSSADDEVLRQQLDATTMAKRQAKTVVPLLTETLRDKDPGVRLQSIKALVGLAPWASESIPVLREALKDPDQVVCKEAEEAILCIDPAEANRLGIERKSSKKRVKKPNASKPDSKGSSPTSR